MSQANRTGVPDPVVEEQAQLYEKAATAVKYCQPFSTHRLESQLIFVNYLIKHPIIDESYRD